MSLDDINSGTQSELKEIKRDVQLLLHDPEKILKIYGVEDYSPNDFGRGAVPYVSYFPTNPKNLNILCKEYEA